MSAVNRDVEDDLERRIDELEAAVKTEQGKNLLESILSANNLLTAAANRGKNIEAVSKRVNELNGILNEGIFPDDVEEKINVVFSMRENHEKNVQLLEKVAALHAALDKGNLKDLDEVRPGLVELSENVAALKEMMRNVDEVSGVLEQWKTVQCNIVRSLAAANNTLAGLENSKVSKKY